MSDVTMIIRAGMLVCAHDELPVRDGAVAVAGNTIAAVGTFAELARRYPHAAPIGGEGDLLIPGLINGHGHGRGLTDFQRGGLDNTLESWLFDTRKYVPVAPYDDLAYSAVRLLKSGVTTSMHNHLLQNPAGFEQEFEEGLKAYRDAGQRVQFNPAVRDRNPFIYGDNAAFLAGLPEDLRRVLTAPPPAGALGAANFVPAVTALHRGHDSDMARIGFGPLAPQWCSDELLKEVREASDRLNAPVHVHAVQSVYQKIYGLAALGKTLVRHMADTGFLGPRVVIGHCVWPTREDIRILSQTGAGVTHHPSCNLRVRNGIAPAFHMLEAGVRVGLGLDGKSINDDDDLIQEMKVCYLLHRLPSLELDSPCMSARQVLRMATETNAALLGYGGRLGRLAPGALADMVLLDYRAICHPFVDPSQDPIDVLMYRGTGRHVHTVLVDGKVVVRGGRVLTVDEEAIAGRLREAASRPRTEAELGLLRMMDTLKERVKAHYAGWTGKVDAEPYFAVNSSVDGLNPGRK
jgi:cytosine/adenosine deaminase-related metal-dependent hydrolase